MAVLLISVGMPFQVWGAQVVANGLVTRATKANKRGDAAAGAPRRGWSGGRRAPAASLRATFGGQDTDASDGLDPV